VQVGDLVTVSPAKTGTYIITDLKGYSSGMELPDCVTLASLNGPAIGYNLPMGKEFIEVISEK
jgi:hypothetical protein